MVTKRRIGIMGGSFNPPHIGHVGICETVLKQGMADEIWVVPCHLHPFDKTLASFEHRHQMCKLAFEGLSQRVSVLDIEKKLGGKSFTMRTIEALQKKYPEDEFILILGEDAAKEAKTWHRYDDLRKAVSWLVIPRGPRSMVPNVSATTVRETLQNHQPIDHLIPKKVAEYLEKFKIY